MCKDVFLHAFFASGFCNDCAAPPPANSLAAPVDKTGVFVFMPDR